MMDNKLSLQDIKDGRFGYLMLVLFVLVLYIATIGIYLNFNNTVLPGGDPFTYTTGFFNLLDQAHSNFWSGIKMAFAANWYWLINIMIVFFSPIIVKEPFSIESVYAGSGVIVTAPDTGAMLVIVIVVEFKGPSAVPSFTITEQFHVSSLCCIPEVKVKFK